MKRCPQCEFIYEDDQSLCDMDGVLLVLDSRTLPNPHALATVPAAPKSHRKNRAVPAFATVVLAGVLGMTYYVSTRHSPNGGPVVKPGTMRIVPITIPTSEPSPTPEPTPEPARPKEEENKQPAQPVKKSGAKSTTVSVKTKRTPETTKEDNKVNSILKKTGRILKKPFKF